MNEEESKETYYANNRIKALRIRAGLDQQSLAEYCGTSKTTISNIENGIAEPRISVVKILANVLGVSIEYLMGWANAEELNAVQVKQNRNGFSVEIKELKEIDDQVLLIVKYVRELKQAEDAGDWDKVVSLSDAIQDSGHNIGKAADKINVAIKRGMHIG